ncbi:MAG: hypothetical protein KJ833_04705 [Alphaproteobacteria bacterium]|nr:hypothetical protein [Alphaproteobacteria bacterium]
MKIRTWRGWAVPALLAGSALLLVACGDRQTKIAQPEGFAAVDTARIAAESGGDLSS